MRPGRRPNVTLSTIERAFALARSGQAPDLASLKRQLTRDGCRAVDSLLAPRAISGHLSAICAAAYKPSTPAAAETESLSA